VTFFNGTSLRPVPPGGTPKSQDTRWVDIHEDDCAPRESGFTRAPDLLNAIHSLLTPSE
jgi:hypothetical protein